MLSSADAVVVGAGAFGASVAYHLARRGKRVALVERHAVASQTSPRAAGLSQQIRSDDLATYLATRAVRLIESFAEDTGERLAFHQPGSIKMARTPHYAEQIEEEVRRGSALGIDVEAIEPSQVERLAPWTRADKALAIWYTASDVYLEPGDLPRAYARAAEGLGATVLEHTAVTAVATRDGAVERVETDQGPIETSILVDAAGAWARVVGEMAGIRVPIVPTRHQLYITAPIPMVRPDQPIVRVLDVNVYVRPERGGLMLGGYEPDPVQVDARDLPAGFQISDLALDFAPLRRLTESVRDQFPILQDAEIAEFRGGLPTMTADGKYVVDQMPGVKGFFVVGGCCVGGLSISPSIGEAVASWAVDGVPPIDMSSFALTRFGSTLDTEERLREACLWRYAHHYSADSTPTGAG